MQKNQMEPSDFAARLDRSFGEEPPHRALHDDLHLGRRQLRRRRTMLATGVLGAAALVVGSGATVSSMLDDSAATPVAAGDTSVSEIRDACLGLTNIGSELRGEGMSNALLRSTMGAARVMTASSNDSLTRATLLAEDVKHWGDCQLPLPDTGVKAYIDLYPTDVPVASRIVDGVRVYEPIGLGDPGQITGIVARPSFWVPCLAEAPEETQAWREQKAACGTFTMTWNDRRPPEVGSAKIVNPDGVVRWADVNDGYLSYTYTGAMTDELAAQLRAGEIPVAEQVTFYDESGRLLARGEPTSGKTGEETAGAEVPTIDQYPSLGYRSQ